MSVEYAVLGGMAALTGISLSLFGAWALAWFVFETTFVPSPITLVLMVVVVVLLTMGIGHINSRDIYQRSPLDVLRSDA
jgi:putative ABC transport system permease protein